MKIFSRYILSEVVQHAVIGASLFTFVIFMRDLGRLLEIVVRNSAPLPSVAELFFLTLPVACTITIPMGLLVGILIGLSRLAADSEVTAMRASGLGAWRFVRIIAIFAVTTWLIALANSVWLAPMSSAALARLQNKLKGSQASFEVQPRVFYEDFKNMVLYVEDVRSGSNASEWRGVFLADVSDPSAPKITLARNGLIISDGPDTIRMHLNHGSQQVVQPHNPDQYEISTFAQTDLPIALPPPNEAKQELVPTAEMSTAELWYRGHHPEVDTGKQRNAQDTPTVRARWLLVEFHRRLALPTSCLVLALVGIPLGLSSKKGGKSMGFVLTITLVFLYYFVSLTGISLGRSGKIPPGVGVWGANFFFLVAGLILLYRVERAVIDFGSLRGAWSAIRVRFTPREHEKSTSQPLGGQDSADKVSCRSRFSLRYPLLLDELILRDFAMYLGMILVSFILLTLVFTFFELLGDIVRNRIPLIMVGQYLLDVTPSMIYIMTPLSVLLAVLTTIGLLQKTNEITAMKATGTSIYRVIFPVFVIAAAISTGLFFFDQFYIPGANQRQETIRNQIKGKPAQTYLRPDRKWIFGEHHTIYYYEFFDPDQNTFGNITAFQFDPVTFELTGRVHASRARWSEDLKKWIFEQGWSRTFRSSAIQSFHQFDADTFPNLIEPPSYFKKEVRQSSEMNYQELRSYIADLQQSGFDVVRLRVQLQKKFAYPLITLVMAILAVPFSLSAGRKGALTGIAVALGVAIVYFVSAGLFEAMGNASQLPAALAAWAPDLIFGLLGGYLLLKVPT
ncbi:MAG TPA: LPS export ABC transporter permease LptF [Candidatus Saccharimonadales bacterium]|nr:LPS export ABC transporter permease LptF [Candidatus Saccharimonadales bacterium]